MTRTKGEAWTAATGVLRAQGYRYMLTRFREDCCIASTAVAIEVLRRFKIEARPLVTRVILMNQSMQRLVQKRGPVKMPEDVRRKTGAWSVGVGFPGSGSDAPGKWDGHLVAMAGPASDPWLLDMSLPQASRPLRGMEFDSVLHHASREFERGEKKIVYITDDGAAAFYEAHPEDRSFTGANDWAIRARWMPVANALTDIILEVPW